MTKRILAMVLALLMGVMTLPVWAVSAAEGDSFTPAENPTGMYKVLQPILDHTTISYNDGYRTGASLRSFSSDVKQTDPANMALYMNVYVDNAEGEDLDLFKQAQYRQIDIQRYHEGEYYEVRWFLGDITFQKGWNQLLLLFETDREKSYVPDDPRMQVVHANKQNLEMTLSYNFNFACSMVEEGLFSQYTVTLDSVAIVDLTSPVNTATPGVSDYRPLQSLSAEMPAQALTYENGTYRATSAPIMPTANLLTGSVDTMAVAMDLFIHNRDLPYYDHFLKDDAYTRRLVLSDGEGRELAWEGRAFSSLALTPGWNRVVFRLTDDTGLWDGIPLDRGPTDMAITPPFTMSLEFSGFDDTDFDYHFEIAHVALVDVSQRVNGDEYYDTTRDVLSFSAAHQTYTATADKTELNTGWIVGDGLSDSVGADISRHNPRGLRLRMTLTLSGSEPLTNDVLQKGRVSLRSVDENGRHFSQWNLRDLRLQEGVNLISLPFSDLQTGNEYPLDLSTVNRLQIKLTGLSDFPGEVTMTVSDVQVVDLAGQKPGEARLATLSEGMLLQDLPIYNLNPVEWGADPTGEADSTIAIQECLDTLQANGGTVFLPAGRYKVAGRLTVHRGVTLRGEWQNPNEGGAGRGTILMAYADAGISTVDSGFIDLKSGGCLRDISVWYPEQNPATPVVYPPTVRANGHTVVKNVTFYNAYTAFYNPGCSSMLIRDFYATALYQGIYGANAYDIPRIERVSIDTRYWIDSGLPNAPTGLAADQLISHCRQTTTGVIGGRQDWGYWYDIEVQNAKIGLMLFAGNDAVGKLFTRNVQYGIYTTNVNAPGLQITHSDIAASVEGIHYQVDSLQTLVASNTVFREAPISIHTVSKSNHGVSLNNCTFEGWSEYALKMEGGHLTAANNTFAEEKPAIFLHGDVGQALLAGNRFASPDTALTAADTTLVARDDGNTATPVMPDYEFVVPDVPLPATNEIFLVTDYGAKANPDADQTAAFQKALDAAGQAGGGTVYVPGGIYRLDGSLTVPAGVELRGSFDGAHYGNSTFNGTQLYVYGGKNDENAAPLLTLGENAGVRGFTVFYPEQGAYDDTTGGWVHTYPYTVQFNKGGWSENVCIVNGYRGFDAITNRCDGLLVRDTTGYTLRDTIQVGHGMEGGTIHNLHLNPSGWTQQGNYPNQPRGHREDCTEDCTEHWGEEFDDYVTKNATYLTLGDCKNLQIFSCFNIIIATQTHLIKDPYTGGCYNGTIWGIAYDASCHGIVCEGGIDSELVLLAEMGVFNQQGGGYNVWTKPGFEGSVTLYNADAWGSNSQIALVEGGEVTFVQYLSMSAYEAICREGGKLNFYNSVITSRSGDKTGDLPDLTFEPGSSGVVMGNLDCANHWNTVVLPGASVTEALNGHTHNPAVELMTFAGTAGDFADTDWVRWDGRADTYDMSEENHQNLRLWLTVTAKADTTATITLRSPHDGEEQTASWQVTLTAGENRLNLPFEALEQGNIPLNLKKVGQIRITSPDTLTLSAAKLIDLTPLYRLKQELYANHLATPADTTDCREKDVAAYLSTWEAAQKVYTDEMADEVAIVSATAALADAESRLIPVDKSALAAQMEVAEGLEKSAYTPESYALVKAALDAATLVKDNPNATIDGVTQALAELTAALEGLEELPTVILGDVNGNGTVTAEDALLALQGATGKVVLTEEQLMAALVSGGDTLAAGDALMILQLATGKIAALV